MPSFDDLRRRGCMGDVIQIVGQVPDCLAMRLPGDRGDRAVDAAVLWSLLAWGRKFWTASLEESGIDVTQLTREVDGLLGERRAAAGLGARMSARRGSWSAEDHRRVDRSLDDLLDRAAREASDLGHNYLGNEHLLLAILAGADGRLGELLSRHGVHHQDVKEPLTAVLSRLVQAEAVEESRFVLRRKDRKTATGVPRRFSMGALFAIMTLYSIVFAVMQSLGADPIFFVVIAVLLTGVGAGQTLLFGGKRPRAASVCTGAVLFPLEIMAAMVYHNLATAFYSASPDRIITTMFFCIPLGVCLGYLAGGLAGGVFVLLDQAAKKMGPENQEA